MTTWGVTTEHVKDTIDEVVSDGNIKRAAASLDPYINRTEAASGIMSPRDLHWIRQAVIWQSAWIRDQSGYTARHAVAQQSEGGLTVSAQAGGVGGSVREWTWTVAPMAARSLKNLSWKASGARHIVRDGRTRPGNDFALETDDECSGSWEPL